MQLDNDVFPLLALPIDLLRLIGSPAYMDPLGRIMVRLTSKACRLFAGVPGPRTNKSTAPCYYAVLRGWNTLALWCHTRFTRMCGCQTGAIANGELAMIEWVDSTIRSYAEFLAKERLSALRFIEIAISLQRAGSLQWLLLHGYMPSTENLEFAAYCGDVACFQLVHGRGAGWNLCPLECLSVAAQRHNTAIIDFIESDFYGGFALKEGDDSPFNDARIEAWKTIEHGAAFGDHVDIIKSHATRGFILREFDINLQMEAIKGCAFNVLNLLADWLKPRELDAEDLENCYAECVREVGRYTVLACLFDNYGAPSTDTTVLYWLCLQTGRRLDFLIWFARHGFSCDTNNLFQVRPGVTGQTLEWMLANDVPYHMPPEQAEYQCIMARINDAKLLGR